jgi:hypothetical protein
MFVMKKYLPAAVALFLLIVSGAAAAQCTPETAGKTGPGPHMPTFSQFDLDGDGSLLSVEFYEARAMHMAERAKAGGKMKHAGSMPTFEDIDTDADGKVSPEEFATHQAAEMGQRRGKES